MTNTVLIVSPHFPPSTLAGVHRARHLAKHLPAHGWRPVVVRVDERHYTERGDPALAKLLPDDLEQCRANAIPARLTRTVGIGDIGLRGFGSLASTIANSVHRYDPKVVMITGAPFYPMLLAGWIKKRFHLPVVLDFQDPWLSAEGAARGRWSKGGISHRLARSLEPRAVRQAAYITSVSDTQNAEMAARYPWLDGTQMAGIPIGGDPDDFRALRGSDSAGHMVRLNPRQKNLCYVGTFLPRAGAVVRTLFKAVRRIKQQTPELARDLRLVFVGTSNQPGPHNSDGHRVTPIAVEEGVADLVFEWPARVPYLEALTLLANAQGLLLLGSDEPHYTASKIYPALMSGRPWLSIFHERSSAHELLRSVGGGKAFAFSAVTDLEGQIDEMSQALSRLALAPDDFGKADSSAYADYTADAVARKFARVFSEVSADASRAVGPNRIAD